MDRECKGETADSSRIIRRIEFAGNGFCGMVELTIDPHLYRPGWSTALYIRDIILSAEGLGNEKDTTFFSDNKTTI